MGRLLKAGDCLIQGLVNAGLTVDFFTIISLPFLMSGQRWPALVKYSPVSRCLPSIAVLWDGRLLFVGQRRKKEFSSSEQNVADGTIIGIDPREGAGIKCVTSVFGITVVL